MVPPTHFVRAAVTLAVGLWGASLAALRPSLASDCVRLLRNGEELLSQQKPAQARTLLLQATRECPRDPLGYNFLGMALDLEGRFKEAQESYLKAIALNPGIAAFHDNLAVSYFRSGQQATGVKEFEKALEYDSQNQTANLNLGTYYLGQKEYRRALKYLKVAQVEHSNDPSALLELTYAYLGAGDTASGLETASRLSSLAGSDARIHFSLGLLLAEHGEYAMAVKQFAAIPQNQRDSAVDINLAMAYSRLGQRPSARQAYAEAIQLDPSDPEPYLRMGLDSSVAGDAGEAVDWLTQAYTRAPERADIAYALAEELIRDGNYERAHGVLSQATNHQPPAPELFEALADLFARQHKDQDAIDAYVRCLDFGPERVSARLSLARVYLEAGRADDAKNELQKVLLVEPKSSEATAELGRIELQAGRQERALRLIEGALAQDPNNAMANEDLAQIKIRQDKPVEAQAALEKLVSLEPNNPRFHYLLSRALSKMQRTQEAAREFELSKKLEANRRN